MVRFHPKLAAKIQVKEGHKFYDGQINAFSVAETNFKKLNSDSEDVLIPDAPDDFKNVLNEANDDLETVGNGEKPELDERERSSRKRKSRRLLENGPVISSPKRLEPKQNACEQRSAKLNYYPEAGPRRSKRIKTMSASPKRDEEKEMDDVDKEPPVLMKLMLGNSCDDDDDHHEYLGNRVKDLEKQLEVAKQTITGLTKQLQRSENQITAIFNTSMPVKVLAPRSPESLPIPNRVTTRAGSISVTSDGFDRMIKQVQDHFREFRTLVFAADDSTSALKRETRAIQGKFCKLISDVRSTEKAAAEMEIVICEDLTELLEADVSIEMLKTHRAGLEIIRIGNACKEMPLIKHICNGIIWSWKTRFRQFLSKCGSSRGIPQSIL